MLTRLREKIKEWGSAYRTDILLGLIVVLVSLTSFGLGRLSVLWETRTPVVIEAPREDFSNAALLETQPQMPREVVASKAGSRYYLPDCPSAKRIKPENLISFETAAEAEAAGYRPAANCPGLNP